MDNRTQTIVDYLKIQPTNCGEIDAFEAKIPQRLIHSKINKWRNNLIRESLVKFRGNIFPIVVRALREPVAPYYYEVVFGAEITQITQDYIRELGEEEAQNLGIKNLRVWLVEIDDEEIEELRDNLADVMNYLN